jgi:uncharacterized protein (DUF1684 family)
MSDAGSDDTDDPESFDPEAWREELEAHREEKDDFFAEHQQSPIPLEERDEFDGLDYFDPDPDYRVTATVETIDELDPVDVEITSAPPQRYLRVGILHFELDGEAHELTIYRQVKGQNDLFVPFRDKTTGQQTYEKGRYMEFQTEGELEDGLKIPLDFNLAYAPFCAYNETFGCPLPPEENWLDTEIRAGEKA